MSCAKNQQGLGAFRVGKALGCLYEVAANHLSVEELELLEQATASAQYQAENLSAVLQSLGSVAAFDKGKHWDHGNATPSLLWMLSNQLDMIAGLIEIGENAEYRLRTRVQQNREG
ncbi:hypothetical protein PL263_04215 [Methylomonas sp. EFPC3]|uniref:hypothetical protein n=1 Tax=Methylomonas sp. EFPC3 TaxID=3021710 RepID=UPI0024163086|nr:hypothetical protein [Methylomonas sp. EFPC3]WFP51234.1 hypothetical protein PL263_04215 [Methylomonas sp. EFPC3]